MRVLVGVKRVVDYAAKVNVATDRTGVALASVKMSMNPFCEIAVEEAVRLKEKKLASEVVALSIGPKAATETLRTAIAMGADKAIHVMTPADMRTDQGIDSLAVAKVFQHFVQRDEPQLVLLGKQAIDGDNCQTGPMLAGLLGWPQGTFAAALNIESADAGASFTMERETDSGTEVLRMSLPAVITADLRLNQPRYPSLPNIMKAKKVKQEVIELTDLPDDVVAAVTTPQNRVLEVTEPPARAAGITVESVDELLDKLRNEAKVIP